MEPNSPEDKSFSDVKERLNYLKSIEKRLSNLVDKREGAQEAQVFHIGHEGQIPVDDVLKTFEGKRMLNSKNASQGDVLWWVSESGSRGYFAVNEKDPKSASIEGSVKIISQDGKTKEYPQVRLLGGGFQMLKEGQFVEGMPLHLQIPPKKNPKNLMESIPDEEFKADYLPQNLRTSPIKDMGQIKSEQLAPESPNSTGI